MSLAMRPRNAARARVVTGFSRLMNYHFSGAARRGLRVG
jgi:hypothetical protein